MIRKLKSGTMLFLNELRNKLVNIPYYYNPNMSILFLIKQKMSVYLNWVFSIPAMNLNRSALVGIRKMRKSKSQTSALIIANGPSANTLNFKEVEKSVLQGELEVFLINFALLDNRFANLNAKYLVLSDELTKPDNSAPNNVRLWSIIKSTPNLKLITPTVWHNRYEELLCDSDTCLHFVDVSIVGATTNISPLKAYGYTPLTAYKALAVANYFCYGDILLIGFDNSMFRSLKVNENNEIIEGNFHAMENYSYEADLTPLYRNGLADYFYGLSLTHSTLQRYFMKVNATNLGLFSDTDAFKKIGAHSEWFKLIE